MKWIGAGCVLSESPSIAHVQSIGSKVQNNVQLVNRITEFHRSLQLNHVKHEACDNEGHRALVDISNVDSIHYENIACQILICSELYLMRCLVF